MPYKIDYNEAGYVEMIHDGIIAMEHVSPIIKEVMTAVKDYDCFLFLGDYRGVDLQLSLALLYEIPRHVFGESQRLGLQVGKFKRALVVSETLYEKFKFLELVSLNRMQNVKVFTDLTEAKIWLLSG